MTEQLDEEFRQFMLGRWPAMESNSRTTVRLPCQDPLYQLGSIVRHHDPAARLQDRRNGPSRMHA
jgi:hypothetical protein